MISQNYRYQSCKRRRQPYVLLTVDQEFSDIHRYVYPLFE